MNWASEENQHKIEPNSGKDDLHSYSLAVQINCELLISNNKKINAKY